jgi:phosphoglycerate dehydrogenase-like enzyme
LAKILIISPIDKGTIATLGARYDVDCAFNAEPEVVAARLADREVVVLRSGVKVTAEAMAGAPELGLIIRAGSGTDNIDLAYAEANGIRLARIPEPGAQAVAELTFALMLSLARGIPRDAAPAAGTGQVRDRGAPDQRQDAGIVGAGNITAGRPDRRWA